VQERINGVGGGATEFGDAAVAGEAGGVADNFAEDGVIGVLVLVDGGCENEGGFHAADDRRDGERVGK